MNEENTKPLMGKDALLRRIQGAFEAVVQTLDQLDDLALMEAVGSGGWTVKDSLAHIAAWERILLEFHLTGTPFDVVTGLRGAEYRVTSYEKINTHLNARYKDLSPAEVRQLVLGTHDELMAVLEEFPEDDLYQPHPKLSVGEAAGLNWIDYIAANTFEHFEEHLAELR
jgi:hypothetical protein